MRPIPLLAVLAALAVPLSGSAQPAALAQVGSVPPPAATAAVSGVVVDGTTGRPVAGAVVALSTNSWTGGTGALARVATDPAGRFVFQRVPIAAAYYLHATKFGYFDGGYGRDASGAREGRRIVLTEGQWYADARIRLWRPASIAGTLRDEAGEPVVGAIVRVLARVPLGGVPQLAAGPFTYTDDRGMYRIGGLTPAAYLVSAPSVQATVPATLAPLALVNMTPDQYASAERGGRAPPLPSILPADGGFAAVVGTYPAPPGPDGGRARVYPPVFYPAARTIAEAVAVDVNYGDERLGIDLQLRPEHAFRVTGRVIGPPEALGGLTLRLVPPGAEGLSYGAEVATALAGENGAFTMLHVPPGDYTLLAGRSLMQFHLSRVGGNFETTLPPPFGFHRSSGGAGTIAAGPPGFGYSYDAQPNDTHFGRTSVSVGAADVAGVVVQMRPSVTVTGRLLWESGVPEPPAVGGAGAPPATGRADFLPIYADPANGDASLGMRSGRVDLATQEFTIEGLRPGLYRLRVIGAPGVRSIVWNGRDLTDRPIDTTAGDDITGVVVTITDRAAVVEGHVRDERGNLPEQALVVAFPTDRTRWTHYGFVPARLPAALLDSAGRYKLTLPAGSYHVLAIDEALAGTWRDPKFLEAAARSATTVSVDWGGARTLDVVLRAIR